MSATIARLSSRPKLDPETGIVRGHASLFGVLDLSKDRVMPGAFTASLLRRGAAGVRMLWQHDPKEPIGRWTTIREDGRGLYVEGALALSTRRGRDVHELIRAGAVDGLSIGFHARRSTREAGGIRRLTELDLWEISVVTFPMQPAARLLESRARTAATRLAERLATAAARLATPLLPAV